MRQEEIAEAPCARRRLKRMVSFAPRGGGLGVSHGEIADTTGKRDCPETVAFRLTGALSSGRPRL